MTKIAVVVSAGVIWMFSFAPAYAQGMTEYLGTTGQSAGQMAPAQSLGSAIAGQFHGAGQAIGSGNTESYDVGTQGQSETPIAAEVLGLGR